MSPNRHGRYDDTSISLRPVVISSASVRPIPPAPPNPFSDRPAASQKPGTPGIGPSSGFASGVMASGWQTSPATPAPSRNGNRRTAPAISDANRSSSAGSARAPCSHGTPSSQRDGASAS